MDFPKKTRLRYEYEGDTDTFTVVGTRSLRGKYFYIVQNSKGEKSSISRASLLDAVHRQVLRIIA